MTYNETETRRCRNMRRVILCLFIICAYLLSTTYAVDVVEYEGEEVVSQMTALNLAFGALGGQAPVRTSKVAIIFIIYPILGIAFMLFDKKSNTKNIVGLVCGILGVLSISFLIGGNIGMGALVSIVLYFVIAILSAYAIFMQLEDKHKVKSERRLDVHE